MPRWQSAGHPYCRWTASWWTYGQVDPGELLDPQVIRQVEEEFNHWPRRAKGEEGLFAAARTGANDR
ncbi:hypothetical protein ACLB1E_21220 [Escherichia coli]